MRFKTMPAIQFVIMDNVSFNRRRNHCKRLSNTVRCAVTPNARSGRGASAAIRRVKTAITASIIDASKPQLMAYVEANACQSYKSMPYNAGAP